MSNVRELACCWILILLKVGNSLGSAEEAVDLGAFFEETMGGMISCSSVLVGDSVGGSSKGGSVSFF